MFGWRARIGQLYPSGGLCDFEPQRMAPPGVQFVTTRMTFRGTRLEDNLRLTHAVEQHAQLLADAKAVRNVRLDPRVRGSSPERLRRGGRMNHLTPNTSEGG